VVFGNQVSLRVHYWKKGELIMLHNTAVTKQWTAKWP